MIVCFLGSSSGMPSKERNLTSININFEGENFLFDAAEGTQRQLISAGISFMKINNIFLSHFHADHILGLPGMLATMNMLDRTNELKIFGPKNVKEKVNTLIDLALMQLNFKVKAIEIKKGLLVESNSYTISAFPLKHSTHCFGFVFKEKDKKGKFDRKKAEALGIPVGPLYSKLQQGFNVKVNGKTFKPKDVIDFSKQRKGRKVSIVLDTMANNSYLKFIKESDLLIHEAVFLEEKKERAKETMHSTAREAAIIARKAKVKQLVLTHLSPRYKDEKEILEEAKKEFENTVVAKDLMKIEIPRHKIE
jgi:ribonuclease Z